MTVLKLPPFLQMFGDKMPKQRGTERTHFPTMSHYLLRRLLLKLHYEVKDPLTRSNKEKQHLNAFPKQNQHNNKNKSV